MREDMQVVEIGAAVRAARAPALEHAEGARPIIAEEQLAYADLLDLGMKAGLLVLTVTFLVYLTGLLEPRIALADLPRYWSLPVKQYLAATGIEAGWGWVRLVGHGDYLNFVGVAFLSGITIVCYLAITPILVRRRDLVFGALATLEVVVLALAASGLVGGGAH